MWFLKSCRSRSIHLATALLALGLTIQQAGAQVIPAADGTGTIVEQTQNQFTIQGGAFSIDGKNLFHSFQELGLSPDQIANFRSNPNIQNIFSRVTGGNPSIIHGLLQVSGGNSNLFLINPAGILFGPTARLELPGSFVSTTATSLDFAQGRLHEIGPQDYQNLIGSPMGFAFGQNPGTIVNMGQLNLAPNQTLGLLGGTVVNTGTIQTAGGQVTIAAIPGSHYVRLGQPGSLLTYDLRLVENPSSTIAAKSLPELLTGGQLSQADDLVVNLDGSVQIRQTGVILPTQSGTSIVAGKVDVTNNPVNNVTAPGQVQILGNQVALIDATIAAQGNGQGGTVLVGGDYQGKGMIPNAQQTFVSSNSTIDVSAAQQGKGGRAIVWADAQTDFLGTAIARGGARFGDGGFIEISGKENLLFAGRTNAGAPNGLPGTVLFDPRKITFKNNGLISLPAPTGIPFSFLPNADLDLDPQIFNENPGNLIFEATETITVQDPINAVGTGDIIFRAGQKFVANADILTTGRSVLIEAPDIRSRNINTAQPNPIPGTNGSITLRGLNGSLANKIETEVLSTGLGQSIQIVGRAIKTSDLFTIGIPSPTSSANGQDLFSPSVTPWVGGGGTVDIRGTEKIDLQRIRTDQGRILINAGSNQLAGDVTSNYLASLGGDVEIRAKTVDLGPIGTGPYSPTNPGGNVTVATLLNLNAGGIDTTGGIGFVNPAGNVTMTSQNGNIVLDSIVSLGSANGNISLSAEKVRIDRTWNGSASISTNGNVQIIHRGGALNEPFRIGTIGGNNGTVGSIESQPGLPIPTVVEKQDIPIQPNPFTTSTPDGRIQVTSQNTPPVLPVASPPILQVQPQGTVNFTLAELGFRLPADAEGDVIRLYVRDDRPSGANQGQIRINGIVLQQNLVELKLNDVLTFKSENQLSGELGFLSIIAADLDLKARPELANVYPTVPIVLSLPSVLQQAPSPIASSRVIPMPRAPQQGGLTIDLNKPKIRTFELEKRLSQEFAQGLQLPQDPADMTNPVSLIQQIEGITGVKPALIYISFLPQGDGGVQSRSQDQLELTLVTAKGITRHRVESVTRSTFQSIATQFRQAVTNPTLTTTETYLPTAQQLYQWLIQPIASELTQQQITNLVFLPEAGARAIPFAALHDGKGFLVENYSVSLMPSLTLTDTRYRDLREATILAVGVSEATQGQTSLPTVPTEIETVMQLWRRGDRLLNQQVTIENLKQARKQNAYGIVHLATHANFTSSANANSYIQLWDQRLQLDQIRQLGWNNPPVDLLVLSACRTALGDQRSELGFAGLALQTGVKTTLASLWYVSDAATTALMSDFYHQLRTAPIKTEALRQAQLRMIRRQVKLSDTGIVGIQGMSTIGLPQDTVIPDYNLNHPYYWAAFSMVGNPW